MPFWKTTQTATTRWRARCTCESSKNLSLNKVDANAYSNGTSDLCLPSALSTSQTANTNTFFDALVAGINLTSYTQGVFDAAQCTGCVYEMFKSAVYTISSIRGNNITTSFGNHLQNDCNGQGGNIDWSNVQDQQIPDALQIQQSSPSVGDAHSLSRQSQTFLATAAAVFVGFVVS